jgi:hypothetical protein
VPPFFKRNDAIVVRVHSRKKIVDFSVRNQHSGLSTCKLKLRLGQQAISVSVNAVKQHAQFLFCVFHKLQEFYANQYKWRAEDQWYPCMLCGRHD